MTEQPLADTGGNAEATSEPARTNGMLLIVEDEAAQAVPEAAVFVRTAIGEIERLGLTGAKGEFMVRLDSGACERLLVCKAGFVQADLELPQELPLEARVVLMKGLTLEGQVVRPDGVRPDEGTLVVAIPVARVARVERSLALLDPGVDFTGVEADAEGHFKISGMQPGRRYELAAGSVGWVTITRTIATAGDVGVELEVLATYGVRVRMQGEHGEPFETTCSFNYHDYFRSSFLDPTAEVPMQRSIELSLAGLGQRELDARPHESVFFLAAPRDLPNLLSMGARIKIPGYRQVEDTIPMPRCLGALEVYDIELHRDAKAWTDLTIDVRSGPWGTSPDEHSPTPNLKLKVLDPSGEWGHLRFPPGKSRHRMPTGVYELELGIEAGGWRPERRDRRKVELRGPEDTLVYEYPSGLGALELELLDRDGWTAHGAATLFYRAAGKDGGSRVHAFTEGPYELSAFPSGEWDMFVLTGFGHSVSGVSPEQFTRVSVRDGEVTSVQLQSL